MKIYKIKRHSVREERRKILAINKIFGAGVKLGTEIL
jgi:hypothetical protein